MTEIEKQISTKMDNAATEAANRLHGIPRNIINDMAENESEKYVSMNGLEEPIKEGAKEQFKELFIDKVKSRV